MEKLKILNSNRWAKEECRKKYIEDESISLKAISVLSGVPKPTLEKWCRDGNWVVDKKEYQKDIKNSDIKHQQELSDIAHNSFKVHYQLLAYVSKIIQLKSSDLADLNKIPESERSDYLRLNHNPYEMDAWSRLVYRSTKGIAEATGIREYIDINAAVKRIEKEGFGVIDISLFNNNDVSD
jgi:hypothetical protein